MGRSLFAGLTAAGMLGLLLLILLEPLEPVPAPPGRPEVRRSASVEQEEGATPVQLEAEEVQPETRPAGEPVESSYDETHTIRLLSDGEVLTLPLEDYLTGVVLAEMPPSFEPEALAAQAVAARTLTIRRQGGPKHEEAELCDQPSCCQAYLSEAAAREKFGVGWDKWEARARTAVQESDGLVMRYQGEPIDAVYFSSSGGRTEAAAAVWGGEVPYLQPVDSPDSGTCFEEEVRVSVEDLRETILHETPEARLEGGPAGWFGALERTEGGGVKVLQIGGISYSGVTLRRLFSLRSTDFTVAVEGEQIVFETRGNGHRVGMSQYGAQAMALAGSDFREILAHYYQGVEIGPA